MFPHRYLFLALAITLAPRASGQSSAIVTSDASCPDPLKDSKALSSYVVREIRFETPFDFLDTVKNSLAAAKVKMPQKEGQFFRDFSVSNGTDTIRIMLSRNDPAIGLPVNITASIAYIENCQAESEPSTLDVVYRVYTSRLPFFASRVPEAHEIEKDDPPEGAGMSQDQDFRFLPRVGFNKSSMAFGGAEFVAQNQGPVEQMSFVVEGAAQRRTAEGSLSGNWAPGNSWLKQLDWHGFYQYTDLPSKQDKLKQSRSGIQISGLMHDFANGRALMRAGFSVEAGNQNSSFDPATLPSDVLASADYSAINSFTGLAFRGRRNSLSLSYGLQLGNSGEGFRKGYRKHIGDLEYKSRWLPARHKPAELELRFTIGSIRNLGGLPVSERFFGGNIQEDFLRGRTWRIRSNPVIRSFSENRLAGPAQGSTQGADEFIALNVTFTPTIWSRPLVPTDLLSNQQFDRKLNGALNTIKQNLALDYESRNRFIDQALAMRHEIEATQCGLGEIMEAFEAANDQRNGFGQVFDLCRDEVFGAIKYEIPLVQGDNRSEAGIALSKLFKHDGTIDKINDCVDTFKAVLGSQIDPSIALVAKSRQPIHAVLSKVNRDAAAKQAEIDLNFARRVIDTFLNEINLAAVAPVLLFDTARLGPQPQKGGQGFRYGVGGGIRFNLVSVARFTVAYACNPDRKPGEDRGALLLMFDIADLFY